MIKITVSGNVKTQGFFETLQETIMFFKEHNYKINILRYIYNAFAENNNSLFSDCNIIETITNETELVLSLGGDGTFLDSSHIIGEKNIMILGINTGRLGFLANISKENITSALTQVISNNYTIENRTLLKLSSNCKNFNLYPYALNEITIHKKESASMIGIQCFVNDKILTTYWADGLIISTATGSTAYNLSVGGPIVSPDADVIILSPIAPHNLTLRPLVIKADSKIKLIAESRNKSYIVSVDHRYTNFDCSNEFTIEKAHFQLKMLKLCETSFLTTLQNKLHWGVDNRN